MSVAMMIAAAFLVVTQPPAGSGRGYDVWFSGRVLSIDRQHGTVRIARGPTETASPAIEECGIRRGALYRLRPGMVVEAQADTRRRPWHILHMRIFERERRQSLT
jgi:hypothetical protein